MKRMVINSTGVGFAKIEALNDIKILKEISIDNAEEGIATLKKNMSNKATVELAKEIKMYYNQN